MYIWKISISKMIDHVNIIQIYVLHLCVTVTVCLLNICTCCLYINVMQCVTAGFDCVMTSVIIIPCMLHYAVW